MGRVGKILSFVRAAISSDVKVDRGGQDTRTPQHFSDIGDDSFPLAGDFTQLVGQAGSGRDSVVGYVDPKNAQKAAAGEKRIYARDADSGAEVIEMWLKNDGSAVVSNAEGELTLKPDGAIKGANAAGAFELLANGSINLNGVIISPTGVVTIPTSLVLAGKEIAGHNHSQANDSAGNVEQDTGVNN